MVALGKSSSLGNGEDVEKEKDGAINEICLN